MNSNSVIYNGKNYEEVNKFLNYKDSPYRLPLYALMIPDLGTQYISGCNPVIKANSRIHKIEGKFYQEYLGNQDENNYTI